MKETALVWCVIALCATLAVTEIWKDRRAEAMKVCSSKVQTAEQTIECAKVIFGESEK